MIGVVVITLSQPCGAGVRRTYGNPTGGVRVLTVIHLVLEPVGSLQVSQP